MFIVLGVNIEKFWDGCQVLLAAGIALALAFTFSCSDDGGGGNGGDDAIPGPTKVGDIQTYNIPSVQVYDRSDYPTTKYAGTFEVVADEYGKVGDIKDGKISLDLKEISSFNSYRGFEPVYFSANDCWRVVLYGAASETLKSWNDVKARTLFFYASEKGKYENEEYGEFEIEKGWNLLYRLLPGSNYAVKQPEGLTWNWYIYNSCED